VVGVGVELRELLSMTQLAAVGMSAVLLPDPNLWETSVVDGTNRIATRSVLRMFCCFSMIGTKQNEYKMMALLDSPDEMTRLYTAAHFAAISCGDPYSVLVIGSETRVLRANPDWHDKYLNDLKAQIDYWRTKAPEIINNLDKPNENVQRARRTYQYFN